jgi:hypothetical protein
MKTIGRNLAFLLMLAAVNLYAKDTLRQQLQNHCICCEIEGSCAVCAHTTCVCAVCPT